MKKDILDIDNKKIDSTDIELINKDEIDNTSYLFNRYIKNRQRTGTASTKTRSEVKCSTAKAYKQKGTGNARRGAKSSPTIRGGGVIFGPTPRSYQFKLNSKFKKNSVIKLMSYILSKSIILDVSKSILRTKDAVSFIKKNKMNDCTLLLTEECVDNILGFRNVKNIRIYLINQFEVDILLNSDNIIITKNALTYLKENNYVK